MVRNQRERALFSLPPAISTVNLYFLDAVWGEHEHASERHEFHWLRKGRLAVSLGGKLHEAGVGDFLFIPQRTVHRDIFNVADPCEVLMVQFGWPPWDARLMRLLPAGIVGKLSETSRQEARFLLDMLFAETVRASRHQPHILNALFHAVLLKIMANDVAPTPPPTQPDPYRQRRGQYLVNEARRYLAKHFDRRVAIRDVAGELKVSPYHLCHVFRDVMGQSLHEYLMALRISRAEALLLEGQYTVAQIAHATGFSSGNYFAKVFRKYRGRAPKAVLNRHPARKG